MIHVTRLVSYVEVDEAVADPRRMSVSARLAAVLTDGRRVPLLADRGWSESGPADIWARTSVEEVERTAHVVVGPDEPHDGHSRTEMERRHWDALAAVLRHRGVAVDGAELARLPHEVVHGEQVLARLAQPGSGPGSSSGHG